MHVSFDDALQAAAHVRAGAAAHRAVVTVAVCDAAGDLVLLHRAEGAPGFSAELAAAKAYTAARFGSSTADLERMWADRPVFAHSVVAQGGWFVGRGGAPIKRGGVVVGAVGVSGAEPAGEEELADRAASLIGDRNGASQPNR